MNRRERVFEYLQKMAFWDVDLATDTKKAVDNFCDGRRWVGKDSGHVIDYLEELETLVFHCIENHKEK